MLGGGGQWIVKRGHLSSAPGVFCALWKTSIPGQAPGKLLSALRRRMWGDGRLRLLALFSLSAHGHSSDALQPGASRYRTPILEFSSCSGDLGSSLT